MQRKTDKYAAFVEHPRYGRRPNVTGLNPSPMDCDVHLHWNATTHKEFVVRFETIVGKKWPYGDFSAYCQQTQRIPNTAVAADLARQTPATVPVTHYFDLERQCRDCKRPFIFFAEEQKYWYEQLGFGLESDCVRCVDCRKKQQGIARQREIYESLFHVRDKDQEQTLAMAYACLCLTEQDVFTTRQTQRVRMLLNSIPEDAEVRRRAQFTDLVNRLRTVEAKSGAQTNAPEPPIEPV